MDTTKARKQGNSIMLTVPKDFHIKAGTVVKPHLTSEGIFYEFVKQDDFFDFDEEILKDLVAQGLTGQELVNKFSYIKRGLPKAMDKLIQETEEEVKNTKPLTKEEAAREIGL
ncbi:MAG: toxin-antitoxin system [Lactobacillus sp.]|jgi:hypothetical protein|nr:toxin-antitoxin system [Lactobacillus sp.]